MTTVATTGVTTVAHHGLISFAEYRATEGDSMAERYVEVDDRRIRVGTIDDAAALCRTNDGRPFSVTNYRLRMRAHDIGAPRPLIRPSEDDPDVLVALRNDHGQRLFPLFDLPEDATDAVLLNIPGVRPDGDQLVTVQEWERTRPRKGGLRTSSATPDTLSWTAERERILVAIRDGRLEIPQGFRPGHSGLPLIDGQQQSKQVAQAVGMFRALGMASAPGGPDGVTGSVPLTEVGAAVLTRWGVKPPGT